MAWQDVVTALRAKYKLSAEGADRSLTDAYAQSDLFNLHFGLAQVKPTSDPSYFRPQDVEPLLDQATTILERALVDRTSAQSLGEKLANVFVELTQAFALDAITTAEEAAGRFDVDAAVSRAQEQANKQLRDTYRQVAGWQQALHDFVLDSGGEGNCNIARASMLAYTRAMYSETTCAKPMMFPINVCGNPYGAPSNRIDIDAELTRQLQWHEQHAQSIACSAAVEEKTGQGNAVEKTGAGIQAQRAWNEQNAQFLRQRADAVRQAIRLKATLRLVAGALDFEPQMRVARQRYQQQLADAYARLQAVATGLARLYAYSPNGAPDPLPALNLQDATSFDNVLAWVRRATAWLAGFSRRCHNYVLPLSVRHLTANAWEGGKRTGEWSFAIDPDFFDDSERHVRIRGMCGWCVGKDGPYSLDVWIPGLTQIRYWNGQLSQDFDQHVPRFRLGRVSPRKGAAVAEVSGLTALFNASPIGQWRVTAKSPTSAEFDAPDDFQIDLYLSVLPVDPRTPVRS